LISLNYAKENIGTVYSLASFICWGSQIIFFIGVQYILIPIKFSFFAEENSR